MLPYNNQVGLGNLGNTCFMNSALQILYNTPGFVDYILNDLYQYDINLVNPLASRGEIIQSFASLMKEMKNRKQQYVVPNAFKKIFSKFYNIYYGNDQHDASEFLLQLLDAINEDVNQIKQKPYVSAPSYNGREDLVVAIESWDVHSQRNQSIITQLFQAQYKSKIECPYCKNMSITFDPYMIVQLPLASKKNENGIIYYLINERQQQKQMDVPLYKNYNVGWLKDEIRDLLRTTDLVFDLSNKEENFEIRLEDDLMHFKQQLKSLKLLVRPMNQQEIQIPFNMRVNTLITHINPEYQTLTEIITILFDFRTKIFEIYDFVEKNYASSFQCGFEIFLKSNSNETEQQCYFCRKPFCKYCKLQKSHSLKYYSNFISQPNFKLNIIIMWYEQGIPIIFNNEQISTMQKQEEFSVQKSTLTIYDCLNFSQQQQQLDENNLWYCKQCKQHVKAIKQMQIYSAPQILLFHLKRFKSSDNIYTKTKNNILVKFPLQLNMTKFVSNLKLPNDYLNGFEINEIKYKLYGVINHFGDLHGGHYNAFVRSQEEKKWFCCDDSSVTEIQPQDIITENAYVLCYERIN